MAGAAFARHGTSFETRISVFGKCRGGELGGITADLTQPMVPNVAALMDRIIAEVPGNGRCLDTRRCHTAIIDRQAKAIITIRKSGRPWKEDCPAVIARNETLGTARHYGRAFWKRWTACHARSCIEAKMRGLKAIGECIVAIDPDRQTAEIRIHVAPMICFSALGTAEIIRVA